MPTAKKTKSPKKRAAPWNKKRLDGMAGVVAGLDRRVSYLDVVVAQTKGNVQAVQNRLNTEILREEVNPHDADATGKVAKLEHRVAQLAQQVELLVLNRGHLDFASDGSARVTEEPTALREEHNPHDEPRGEREGTVTLVEPPKQVPGRDVATFTFNRYPYVRAEDYDKLREALVQADAANASLARRCDQLSAVFAKTEREFAEFGVALKKP